MRIGLVEAAYFHDRATSLVQMPQYVSSQLAEACAWLKATDLVKVILGCFRARDVSRFIMASVAHGGHSWDSMHQRKL